MRKIDTRSANIVGLALLTVIMVGYLALTNENATAGYELRTVERQVESLRDDTRQLDLATIDAQSVPQLSARVAKEAFVPVVHVAYITPTDHAVAAR